MEANGVTRFDSERVLAGIRSRRDAATTQAKERVAVGRSLYADSKGQPEQSNAWIIGFAPADNPKYAIAVVLRGGPNDAISASTGGRLAGPIAKAVLDYMFANNTPTS